MLGERCFMTKFFIDEIVDKNYVLTGEDALHAIKSLRMKVGEKITLCDKNQIDHICTIDNVEKEKIHLIENFTVPCLAEPSINITLYQAMPKGDKMDSIMQKAVEIGVHDIVPVITNRCIVRPDEKSIDKKIMRWSKIAKQAAQQSQRGLIPKVYRPERLEHTLKFLKNFDKTFVFYENGGSPLKYNSIINCKNIGIFIGPEGGFTEQEIDLLKENNAIVSTLGNRILRTETAPLVALSTLIFISENN